MAEDKTPESLLQSLSQILVSLKDCKDLSSVSQLDVSKDKKVLKKLKSTVFKIYSKAEKLKNNFCRVLENKQDGKKINPFFNGEVLVDSFSTSSNNIVNSTPRKSNHKEEFLGFSNTGVDNGIALTPTPNGELSGNNPMESDLEDGNEGVTAPDTDLEKNRQSNNEEPLERSSVEIFNDTIPQITIDETLDKTEQTSENVQKDFCAISNTEEGNGNENTENMNEQTNIGDKDNDSEAELEIRQVEQNSQKKIDSQGNDSSVSDPEEEKEKTNKKSEAKESQGKEIDPDEASDIPVSASKGKRDGNSKKTSEKSKKKSSAVVVPDSEEKQDGGVEETAIDQDAASDSEKVSKKSSRKCKTEVKEKGIDQDGATTNSASVLKENPKSSNRKCKNRAEETEIVPDDTGASSVSNSEEKQGASSKKTSDKCGSAVDKAEIDQEGDVDASDNEEDTEKPEKVRKSKRSIKNKEDTAIPNPTQDVVESDTKHSEDKSVKKRKSERNAKKKNADKEDDNEKHKKGADKTCEEKGNKQRKCERTTRSRVKENDESSSSSSDEKLDSVQKNNKQGKETDEDESDEERNCEKNGSPNCASVDNPQNLLKDDSENLEPKSEPTSPLKPMLKLIDINKLMPPGVKPLDVLSPNSKGRKSVTFDSSVIILTSSDDEENPPKVREEPLKSDDDDCIRLNSDSDPENPKRRSGRNKEKRLKQTRKMRTIEVSDDSSNDSDYELCKKSRTEKNKMQNKLKFAKLKEARSRRTEVVKRKSEEKRREKNQTKRTKLKSYSESSEDSDTESNLEKIDRNDSKFNYKVFISLPKFNTEELQDIYRRRKEVFEVKRSEMAPSKKSKSVKEGEEPKVKKLKISLKNSENKVLKSSDSEQSGNEDVVEKLKKASKSKKQKGKPKSKKTEKASEKPVDSDNDTAVEGEIKSKSNLENEVRSSDDEENSKISKNSKRNAKKNKGNKVNGTENEITSSDDGEDKEVVKEKENRSKKSKNRTKNGESRKNGSDNEKSDNEAHHSEALVNGDCDASNHDDSESEIIRNEIDTNEKDSDNGDKSDSESEKDKTDEESKKQDSDDESISKEDDDKENEDTEEKKRKKNKDTDSDSGSDKGKDSQEKKKQKRDEEVVTVLSDDSEDEIMTARKKKKDLRRKGKKKKLLISDSEDSDGEKKSDDSDVSERKASDKSSDDSANSGSDKDEDEESERKRRRRIKRDDNSSSDDDDKSTRKSIRKLIDKDSLSDTTKRAEADEKERKARIADKQRKYNQLFELKSGAVADKIILDFDEKNKKELLTVNKKLVKNLKPHQVDGVKFMWDACFESIERIKKTKGSGCILAHCMGLGKTLQVIALAHTLLINSKKTKVEKIMVVSPVNTVLNWRSEFKKWLPKETEFEIFDLVSCRTSSINYERSSIVQEWHESGGVLIIGYNMFRTLSNPDNKAIPKKLRATFQEGLVDPGPDLVVCDEGHLLKNEKTNLSIAMNRIRTLRRIVLTGTPLQNNLKEYWCMVQFIKPNLLGTYKEYLNRFVNPIINGQYTDSTLHDIQLMRKRSHVLHKLLDGVVQRQDYCVLAPYLPPKHEYVLFINLTEVQKKLYRHYMDNLSRRGSDGSNRTSFLFVDFQQLQRICTHPRVLLDKSKEDKVKNFDDEEDSEGSLKDFIDDGSDSEPSTSEEDSSDDSGSDSSSSVKKKSKKKKKKEKKVVSTRMTRAQRAQKREEGVESDSDVEMTGPKEWWQQFVDGDELDNINLSGKMQLLFQVLKECEEIGDKVLVFSQSLYTLNSIEYFLQTVDEASQSGDTSKVGGYAGSWALGLDYFRLDGSSSCDNRAAWCDSFNNPSNTRARLFLISTKAGGLGINLVAANRVIIFDVSWNPSHDIQSIYRVYRFGQTKPCYIYRFVSYGTMEMKIYERQVTKQAISKRVIDEQQIDRHYSQNDIMELYKVDLEDQERPIPLVPKDVLLGEMLQKYEKTIFKYHEHQSLLENKEEEGLNEEERKAAWEEFENEKVMRQSTTSAYNLFNTAFSNTALAGQPNFSPAMIQGALFNIVKKDNPTWADTQIRGILPALIQQLQVQMSEGDFTMYARVQNEIKLIQQAYQQQEAQRLQQAMYQRQLALMQQQMIQNKLLGNFQVNPAMLSRMFQQPTVGGVPMQSFVRPPVAGVAASSKANMVANPAQKKRGRPSTISSEVIDLND